MATEDTSADLISMELCFIHLAENLKKELRHSWLSNSRQESVAEHSWRLALMAYRLSHRLDQNVNTEKCIKMALIHDLAEAITGDTPVFNTQTPKAKQTKFEDEREAMLKIKTLLSDDSNAEEFFTLWHAYEDQQCYESKFIKALDKIEVFIQHNEASLTSWTEREKRMLFQNKWLKKYCAFDSWLAKLADAVISDGIKKLSAAGENIKDIEKQAKEEELAWETAQV